MYPGQLKICATVFLAGIDMLLCSRVRFYLNISKHHMLSSDLGYCSRVLHLRQLLTAPVVPSMAAFMDQLMPKSWLCLQIRNSDKIILDVDWGRELVGIVEQAIERTWTNGYQKTSANEKSSSITFKFRGSPFNILFGEDCVCEPARSSQMLLEIVKSLHESHWHLAFSCMSQEFCTGSPCSAWFFKRTIEKPKEMCAVTLRSSDKIALTNADEHFGLVKEIAEQWIQNEEQDNNYGCLKLKGNPWTYNDLIETLKSGDMFLQLIPRLAEKQLKLSAVANVRSVGEWMFFEKSSSCEPPADLMAMFLVRSDRIRLVIPAHSERLKATQRSYPDIVSDCIRQHWKKGIQHIKVFPCINSSGGCVIENLRSAIKVLQNEDRTVIDPENHPACIEFKLRGHPWGTTSDSESHAAKHLLINLIKTIREQAGWEIEHHFVIARPEKTKSCFLLRRREPVSVPHMAIWLKETDSVVLVNADEKLTQALTETVRINWREGIQSEDIYKHKFAGVSFSDYKIKLKGCPWLGLESQSTSGYRLLTALLEELNAHGWEMVAAPDFSWVDSEGCTASNDKLTWVFAQTGKEKKADQIDVSASWLEGKIKFDQPPNYEDL